VLAILETPMDPIDAMYLPFSTEVVREHLAKADNELFKSALGDPDSDGSKGGRLLRSEREALPRVSRQPTVRKAEGHAGIRNEKRATD